MSDLDCILYGLIISCPLKDAKEDCPIAEFRNLPAKKRYSHLKTMPKDDRVSLYCQHKECLKDQEGTYFGRFRLRRKRVTESS